MTPIVWATSKDGQFDFISLSAETLEGGLNVMRNAFFKYESVAVACEVAQNSDAAKELEELTRRATRDGVSLVAIDKKTGMVAAAAFNKILIKNNPGDDTYFENYVKNCKYESSKALVQFMIDADATVNLFEHYNVDCIMEVMFLATLPEYRKKGLGKKLFELSVEVCRALLRGEPVKVPVDDNVTLPLEPVPKVVSSILTSFITQKITKDLGFVKLNEISFEKFFYQGHAFASRIMGTKTTTLESLKL